MHNIDKQLIILSLKTNTFENLYNKIDIPFINILIQKLENIRNTHLLLITDNSENIIYNKAQLLLTKSLNDFSPIISKSKLFISNNSDLLNLAVQSKVSNIIHIGNDIDINPDNTKTNYFSFIPEHSKLTPKQIEQLIKIVINSFITNDINTTTIIKTYLEIDNNKHAVIILNNYLLQNKESKEIWHLLGKASYEQNKNLSIQAYLKSIDIDPTDTDVYLDLARCYYYWRDFEEASTILLSILETQPSNAQAYLLLGYIQAKQNNISDTFECLKNAYELDNQNSIILDTLARTIQELGDIQTSKKLYEESIKLDKNYAPSYFHLAQIEFLLGNYKTGWNYYEQRYNITATSRMKNIPLPMPRYNYESLKNKKIFIYHEQGLGDTIQFIRYTSELIKKGAIVTIFVQKPLYKLLKFNFTDIKFITQIENAYDCDYHLSMLSLPLYLKLYEPIKEIILSVKEKSIKTIKKNKFKIGLVWQGNKEHPNDHNRSINPLLFSQLTKNKNIQLYSLQKDATNKEQNKVTKNIIDTVRKSKDFYDTAQIIQELDLIITIDSGVAHLSASLGKPTWILLPHNPDWRWKLEGYTTPWYKSAVLFRKEQNQSWENVITNIINKLDVLTS